MISPIVMVTIGQPHNKSIYMLAKCAKPCEEQMGDILNTATASTGKLKLRKDVRDFTEISDTTDIVGCIFAAV